MIESKVGAVVIEHARQLAERGYSVDEICASLQSLPYSAKEVRDTARRATACQSHGGASQCE
jgi:hypothetical protein